MAVGIVFYPAAAGGTRHSRGAVSKGQSALPTGGSRWNRALPGGTAGPRGPGELAIAPLCPLGDPPYPFNAVPWSNSEAGNVSVRPAFVLSDPSALPSQGCAMPQPGSAVRFVVRAQSACATGQAEPAPCCWRSCSPHSSGIDQTLRMLRGKGEADAAAHKRIRETVSR